MVSMFILMWVYSQFHIADTGIFRMVVPVGELAIVARHYKLPSLNAMLNVIASSRDSVYIEMRIGEIFY